MKEAIRLGETALGIEFGSTRIKAVLIGADHRPLASGSHEWENQLVDGVWTYSLAQIEEGLQGCYRALKRDVHARFGITLRKIGAIGISAMMHGYLPFDGQGRLLTPFRTWRNTMTGPAAEKLTALFDFNISQRWSLAHLYQAMLNGEAHVKEIRFLTTLAGYAHWRLTGEKVLGVGDASGIMPIDSATGDYDAAMVAKFDELVAPFGYPWKLKELLPRSLPAGADAGRLTDAGARWLDPEGDLESGIPLCPPEGDAGTGMTATNSVGVRTGNVSAGTSIFSMVVLEKPLAKVYPEIDMVTTPTGKPVAMVHCNSCTSDLNAWVGLFRQFTQAAGMSLSNDELYGLLYRQALQGDADCGGVITCNYFSGEPVTGLAEGRPLAVRRPDARFTLANLMRSKLFSAVATLSIGMELLHGEQVRVERIMGHGGLFKTPEVGQRVLAAAIDTPVTVMETAGEGGAWGIGLLAMYMLRRVAGESLEAYLDEKVFAGMPAVCLSPDARDVEGFHAWLQQYRACLPVEQAAVNCLR